MMRRKITISIQILFLALLGLPAAVGARSSIESDPRHHAWARVIESEPVYASVRVVTPHTECWTERVVYEPQRSGPASPTPMLLGATMGGLLGREIGHRGRGRTVGTIVGAVLGGSIGHDMARRHEAGKRRGYREVRDEERCETREEVSWERELTGYDVRYRYQGRTYETRMASDPGERLRVVVEVFPSE